MRTFFSGKMRRQAPNSLQQTRTNSPTSTVVFNVGGRRFELSTILLLDKYPDSTLSQMVRDGRRGQLSSQSQLYPPPQMTQPAPNEIFLDHNPEAFSVIADYLRYGGKLLCPPTVSAEVVTLQLKQLGLTINPSAASGNNEKRSAPLPEVEQLTELPPSYEQTVGGSASSKSSDTELGRLAGRTMMARLQSLVKIVIHPLLVEHARRGHVAVCFYFVDVRFIPKEVATTIEDDLPVEWVLLADGSRLQNNNSAAYNPSSLLTSPCAFASSSSSTTPLNNNNDSLIATLRSVPGLTGDQIERLVAALRVTSTAASDSHSVPGNKPTSPVEDFPDTGYLLQTGVFEKIEPLIHKESNAISAKLERRDLTVRRENEYGLIESSSIIAVRLWVRIA